MNRLPKQARDYSTTENTATQSKFPLTYVIKQSMEYVCISNTPFILPSWPSPLEHVSFWPIPLSYQQIVTTTLYVNSWTLKSPNNSTGKVADICSVFGFLLFLSLILLKRGSHVYSGPSALRVLFDNLIYLSDTTYWLFTITRNSITDSNRPCHMIIFYVTFTFGTSVISSSVSPLNVDVSVSIVSNSILYPISGNC